MGWDKGRYQGLEFCFVHLIAVAKDKQAKQIPPLLVGPIRAVLSHTKCPLLSREMRTCYSQE